MTVRVYLPSSIDLLREAVVSGGLGPAPLLAHAVTDALRAAHADAGDDEWDYIALTAAAQDSLAVPGPDVTRRVVVVADVGTVLPVAGAEDSLVEVADVVPLRSVAAVYADSADAAGSVAAARAAWAAAEAGDEAALRAVERCLDHDLGWFATQEIGDLVEGRTG